MQKKESLQSSRLSEALHDAQSIVQAAELRAKEIITEAERVWAEAREQGFAEGFTQGKRDATQASIRMLEEQNQISARLSEEAARLALAISATILGEHAKVSADAATKIASAALRDAVIGESVSMVCSPKDLEDLQNNLPALRRIAGGVSITLESDPSLTQGGCIVRTEFGEVDASIETLLLHIGEKLGIPSSSK